MFDLRSLTLAVVVLGLTFVMSIVLTWCTREIAIRRGLAPPPQSPRHVHVGAIPRLGGIPVFVTVMLTALVILLPFRSINFHAVITARLLGAFVLPGTVAFAAGLYDDIVGLRPISKLFLQAASGVLMFAFGLRIFEYHKVLWSFDFGLVLSAVATVFWVVLICNAINLIDGLDGLAAGSSLISLITIIFVAGLNSQQHIVLAGIVLSGAILGFLRFNFNPASIFLGDSGSLYLGVMLSGLSMAALGASSDPLWKIAAAVIGFGLPVIETMVSVMRRLLSRSPIFGADRDHIHHRLLNRGLSHRRAVLLLYGVSAGCAVLSYLLLQPGYGIVLIIGSVVLVGTFVGIQKLGYPEFKEIARLLLRTAEQNRVVANNVAIRKTANSLTELRTVEEIWDTLISGFATCGFDAIELDINVLDSSLEDVMDDDAAARYYWSWRGQHRVLDLSQKWEIALDLTTEGGKQGALRMYRVLGSEDLLLDVNVLTQQLQPALASALGRLQRPTVELKTVKSKSLAHSSPISSHHRERHFTAAPRS